MSNDYSLYLSLSGEIIIKNNNSLTIYVVNEFGISQAFANDKELFGMILFPLEKIPKGKTWKRHRKKLKKILFGK